MKQIAIVGAGFSGAVIARRLAEAEYRVSVFDKRNHIAGNCHTKRDADTGIMTHVYGPHIFHTNNESVWQFVTRYAELEPYINRVKAVSRGKIYSFPVNLHTINQFYGINLNPSAAEAFIDTIRYRDANEPASFEEQALRFIGRDLYEAFFMGYTIKQWGVSPDQLPASILKRLPVRFSYDDNYFSHRFQGIPRDGYTALVAALLNHSDITVHLNTVFTRQSSRDYAHVFYSGSIDGWFKQSEGYLGYRTLDFEPIRADGDFQGCAVINYCDREVPYTRISEHKHFAPRESHLKTIAFREFSRSCEAGDIEYYPIRLVNEKRMLARYVQLARTERAVTFVGRLGTYRYLDMDQTIDEAMKTADIFLASQRQGIAMPAFIHDPLA
jgi:UDP-galactopyranose mutase